MFVNDAVMLEKLSWIIINIVDFYQSSSSQDLFPIF